MVVPPQHVDGQKKQTRKKQRKILSLVHCKLHKCPEEANTLQSAIGFCVIKTQPLTEFRREVKYKITEL